MSLITMTEKIIITPRNKNTYNIQVYICITAVKYGLKINAQKYAYTYGRCDNTKNHRSKRISREKKKAGERVFYFLFRRKHHLRRVRKKRREEKGTGHYRLCILVFPKEWTRRRRHRFRMLVEINIRRWPRRPCGVTPIHTPLARTHIEYTYCHTRQPLSASVGELIHYIIVSRP